MPYRFRPDVDQLVRRRMTTGRYATEDDLLREALQALDEEDEDLAAVREAVAEQQAGDEGVPLDNAFDWVAGAKRSVPQRSADGFFVAGCALRWGTAYRPWPQPRVTRPLAALPRPCAAPVRSAPPCTFPTQRLQRRRCARR